MEREMSGETITGYSAGVRLTSPATQNPLNVASTGFIYGTTYGIYARTASYTEVTEKLYDRSRYRYRHYLKHLEPVTPILAPAIEQLGYSVG
jgi:hypothetical protein